MKAILKGKQSTILWLIALLFGLFAWPMINASFWDNIVISIREAIYYGDSGRLVMAAVVLNIVSIIGLSIVIIPYIFIVTIWRSLSLKRSELYLLSYLLLGALFLMQRWLFDSNFDILTFTISFSLVVYLVQVSRIGPMAYNAVILIAIQALFALQWLSIMPWFSVLRVGRNDLPVSIKIAAQYLQSEFVLNYIGVAFLLPLLISSLMTALFFRIQNHNIAIERENFAKARELEGMQEQLIKSRLYQEVNNLAHDLKTPLVTIRGLNSLLPMTNSNEQITAYSARIEGAVSTMNDMISGFLYSDSKQPIAVETLMDYIRAQLPTEDENITCQIDVADDVEPIVVNKIRMSRALVNILENAMIAPCQHAHKRIDIKCYNQEDYLIIDIIDNGMGIRQADLAKIWTIGFSQNKTSGLGLAFVKETIENHKGSIAVNSTYGMGTRVSIQLPKDTGEEHE